MAQGKARARKGGEYGKNGLFYNGGEFLPSTQLAPMTGGKKNAKTRKQEIAPYTWEVPPTEKHYSIYRQVAGVFAVRDGDKLKFAASQQTLDYFKTTKEEAEKLIEMWNNGERWIGK